MDNLASVPCDTRVNGNTMPPSFIASYLLGYGRPELLAQGSTVDLTPFPLIFLLGYLVIYYLIGHRK